MVKYQLQKNIEEYDEKDKIFYGKLENINDMINFHTGNYMEIENEFHNAVDDYLDFCKEVGKEPEVPQSYDFK